MPEARADPHDDGVRDPREARVRAGTQVDHEPVRAALHVVVELLGHPAGGPGDHVPAPLVGRGRLDDAVGLGLGAVVGIAFASVVREGLETTLLFFASAQGAVSATPLVGLAAGLASAVALGALLYAGAVRIDLSRFFTVSGVLLVFVAAGIFKYGIHDFQEAGVLPGLTTYAYDASSWLQPGSWYGAVLDGVFHISAQPTVLEVVAYLAYLVPVLALFLLPGRSARTTPTTTSEHVDAHA